MLKYIETAISLHKIKNIYLFVHGQCGGYAIDDIKKEKQQQIEDLLIAKENLSKIHPTIKIHCLIADKKEESAITIAEIS